MMANTIGYTDVVLAFLTVTVLFLRNGWVRLFAAVPVSIVAMMLHEMFLFCFAPVLLLSFVLEGISKHKRALVASGIALLLVTGMMSLRIAAHRPLTPEQTAALVSHVSRRLDFVPSATTFLVLQASAKDNVIAMQGYFHQSAWYFSQLRCVAIFGPTAALFLFWTSRLLRRAGLPRWTVVLAVLCGCSPVLMNLVAWDFGRFNGLTCFSSFLVLISALRFVDGPALRFTIRQQQVVILVLLCSMASGGLLMGRPDKMFPEDWELRNVIHEIHAHGLLDFANAYN